MLYKNTLKTISYALKFGRDKLIHSSPTSLLEVDILLSWCLNLPKEYLYSHPEYIISDKTFNKFNKLLNLRKKSYPISYLIKQKEFYGRNFFVNNNVLIPRPETETIIDIIKKKFNRFLKFKRKIKILDICTGSGCIPITLKMELEKKITIKAFDISTEAIKVAKKNLQFLKSGYVNFYIDDLFNIKNSINQFDIITSNPPYLDALDLTQLSNDVKQHEPILALDGGKDGLKFYLKLAELIEKHLKSEGFAIFEINEKYAEKTAAIFSIKNSCEIIKDSFNKERFILIQKK